MRLAPRRPPPSEGLFYAKRVCIIRPQRRWRRISHSGCCNWRSAATSRLSRTTCSATSFLPDTASCDARSTSRVIYVRSFSKTLSGSLRVGFIASRPSLIESLADIKMLTSITSFGIHRTPDLPDPGRWQLSKISCAVAGAPRRGPVQCHSNVRAHWRRVVCRARGWHVLVGTLSADQDFTALAERAAGEGIMLTPGAMFHPQLDPSPWMRFNVAFCNDPRVQRWLERTSSRNDQD